MENTGSVVKWLEKTEVYKFLMFDINEFYPSIKETLFHEALQFAKMHVNISLNDIKVMFHSRKSLLYNSRIPWVR